MSDTEYQLADDFFSEDSLLSTAETEEFEEALFSEDEGDGARTSRFHVDDKVFTHSVSEKVAVRVKRLCCVNDCFTVIEEARTEDKEEFKRRFEGTKPVQKNKMLAHLRSTAEADLEAAHGNHDYFHFQQSKMCPRAFSELVGISKYMCEGVRSDFNRGRTAPYEHGNRGKGRLTVAGSNFISWMLDFAQKYAQASPDELLVILPKIFIKTELFQIYEKEVDGPKVKKNSFYKLFKTQFGPNRQNKNLPRIRISIYSSHAKCDTCVKLSEARKLIKSSEDLKQVRARTQQHRTEYGEARIEVNRLLQLTQSLPREFLGES